MKTFPVVLWTTTPGTVQGQKTTKRPWSACVRNLTGAIYIYPGFSENHCHCDAWNMAVEGCERIVAFSYEEKNLICQEENLEYL